MATQPLELTRLMSNVRNHVPGALDGALKLELFNVLDEILQKSNFWQEEINYTVRPGKTSYELVGTENGSIISLLSNLNSTGIPVAATMLTAGTVDLVIDPSQIEVFTATVSYTVTDPVGSDDYPRMPAGLLLKYGVGIAAGVVGRMMAQPAKPYTNERMAIFNSRKFAVTVAQVRAAVQHKNLHGGQSWQFPKFAPGRQR